MKYIDALKQTLYMDTEALISAAYETGRLVGISIGSRTGFTKGFAEGHAAGVRDALEPMTVREDPWMTFDSGVKSLGLPDRILHILLRNKIERVGDLLRLTELDLASLKGCGRTTIDLISETLGMYGYRLRGY